MSFKHPIEILLNLKGVCGIQLKPPVNCIAGVSAELQKTLGLAKASTPSRPVRAFACSALHGDG